VVKINEKSETRDKINELTAQAMHGRTGYDLDACRADAIMKQGLWNHSDHIDGIIAFLGEKYDDQPTQQKPTDRDLPPQPTEAA